MRRLLVLASLALTVPAAAAAAPTLPLDHAGRWITDADGRVVILHGVNMVEKRPPYAPDAVGFGDDDAAFLASEGFDSVRLGVIYKAVEPSPGVYDDAYLDRIAATVATLARHGIVSLLDFHQDLYNERFQGEGWPDWAVLDDGLPAQPQSGFPGNYLAMPALQHAFDNFWADAAGPGGVGIQTRYAAAWQHVAGRFGADPAVLGYDLLNEPWPGTAWQECANPQGCPVADARLAAFVTRMIGAIRQADPATLVFYEPYVLFNFGANTTIGPFGDSHLAMSFHDYCLQAGNTDNNDGCDTADDMVFANADAHAKRTGDALLMTEFGATRAKDILTAMVDRSDRNMVGWEEWHYCGCDDPTTSGPGDKQALVYDPAKPPTGSNIDTGKLAILARPHPDAVAGTPESFGFDLSKHRFTLRYKTARAEGGRFGPDAVTEVIVPARQYPSGYAAHVTGGTIRSASDAAVLRLSACPGAKEVAMEIVPSGSSSASCAAPGAATPARLRLRVRPARVHAQRRVRIVATVRVGTRPVQGAAVHLGGVRALTNKAGHATIRHRFSHAGRYRAVARLRGHLAGRASLRVLR
jgi:endoglycosylceramidase